MLLLALFPAAYADTLTVGPAGEFASPCAAIGAANAGDTIEVDAAGTYDGDTCAWSTEDLTLRGVHGRARIDATGRAVAEQKGIFVIHAERATVESFELSGASVADANGAGIRHQGTDLTVIDCLFHDNENGILGSPITDGTGVVSIERSEFFHNGAGDGYSHNLYLGHYASVTFADSYTHTGNAGHLYKSRALENLLLYSRFTDEVGGGASYEIDLPNAGTAWVVGSIVEQVGSTQNSGIISYGEETSGMNPGQDLHLVNDTLVNDHDRGTFLQTGSTITTPVAVVNTLFVGPGTLTTQSGAPFISSWDDSMGDATLRDRPAFDYHLDAASGCIDAGTDPGKHAPTFEYVHPLAEIPRDLVGGAYDIGAYEYGNTGAGPDDSGTNDSGTEDSGTDRKLTGEAIDGCGCGAGTSGGMRGGVGFLLALAGLVSTRVRGRVRCRRASAPRRQS